MTRGLLALSCRAFPPDHRARRSDEVVDTALLAADGSALRAAREACSLVLVGFEHRLRAESDRPLRDGVTLLAWVFAIVNLAVALAGMLLVNPPFVPFVSGGFSPYGFRPEWWWIAFAVAAAGIVLGLLCGDRRLALGAALANVGVLAYQVLFPANPCPCVLDLISFGPRFPTGNEWLAPAVVLAVATALAPLRRPSLSRIPLTVGAVAVLVWLSRETVGQFLFLRWPLAALLLLAIAFGALVPRLAMLAVGLVIAAAPSGVYLLAGSHLDGRFSLLVVAGLCLATVASFGRLVRRRLA